MGVYVFESDRSDGVWSIVVMGTYTLVFGKSVEGEESAVLAESTENGSAQDAAAQWFAATLFRHSGEARRRQKRGNVRNGSDKHRGV
jgi:hypothetical protein